MRPLQHSRPQPSAYFTPKKHLGQNFLIDPRIKQKIISACELCPDETILEIGPGMGALTDELIKHTRQVIAIEKDVRALNELTLRLQNTNALLIHADFLKYPLAQLPNKIKVVGNLPYYIATPIMERLLLEREKFSSIYITVQHELALRMTASKDTKEYGAFSCFVQYYAQVQHLFKIKNTAFKPVPKVHSAFLKLTPRNTASLDTAQETLLFQIIRQAFQQRRKTIVNALAKSIAPRTLEQILDNLHLSRHLRPENLSLENFIELTHELHKLRHQ